MRGKIVLLPDRKKKKQKGHRQMEQTARPSRGKTERKENFGKGTPSQKGGRGQRGSETRSSRGSQRGRRGGKREQESNRAQTYKPR